MKMVSINKSVYVIFFVIFVAAKQAANGDDALQTLFHDTAELVQKIAIVLKDASKGDLSVYSLKLAGANVADDISLYVKKLEKNAVPLTEQSKDILKQLKETVRLLSSKDVQDKADKIHETYINIAKQLVEQSKDLSNSISVIPPEVQNKLQESIDQLLTLEAKAAAVILNKQ